MHSGWRFKTILSPVSDTLAWSATRFNLTVGGEARYAEGLNVVRLLREAGLLLAIGLVAGTGLALWAGRAAGTLLFGLKPYDPVTLLSAVAVLASVALLSSYAPARRASRVDPMNALRDE